MSEPVVIPAGAGEVVGDSPDRRVEILSDHESLHATWSRFAAGRDGADLHVHRRHTDLFYVLEGELTVRLGVEDEAVAAPAGTLVRVPPLVVHGFRNGSDEEVRYLNLHAPGRGFADFMRALRDGRSLVYDQEPPPAEDVRPASDAAVGGAERVGERAALLADVDEIAIAEVSGERGDAAPQRHLHRRHTESFYVLEGEMTFAVGDREVRAQAGAWVQAPPGVPHTFSFTAPVRFLTLHTPGSGFGAFLRDPATAEFDEEPVA
ncbi:MAG TPA: cupin domain-containing protein [Solirubrobacteraceae bacterium]|nr:cupin domain-containing protein [Solirubrobacteraceae bacterium]